MLQLVVTIENIMDASVGKVSKIVNTGVCSFKFGISSYRDLVHRKKDDTKLL